MAFKYKIRENVNLRGKQRIFFSCYSDDFDKCAEEIMDKILKKCNCAIWYYDKEEKYDWHFEGFDHMTLFVFAISFKFLTTDQNKYQKIYEIAEKSNVPILPIMIEPGLQELFKIKCGSRQYLNMYDKGTDSLSFDEKLGKYLDAVVIGDDIAEKIRKAFDAYIFLSYRKKDRKYAQELMNLIHKNSHFQGVAIWYDEYLNLGENYNNEIQQALEKSNVFVLLVTPSLLEKRDGVLNYVARIEYPLAKENGKNIVPIEMVKTNFDEMKSIYSDLPAVISAYEENDLFEKLQYAFDNIELKGNLSDPEHNYLIGLAYLKGIDVEINIVRAIKLITDAANKNYIAAMKRLASMYENGDNVRLDYNKALEWRKKIYEECLKQYGEEHPDSLAGLNNLAISYSDIGDFCKAREMHEKCYKKRKAVLGDDHPKTIISLNNLAVIYGKMGNYNKAIEMHEKCYEKT